MNKNTQEDSEMKKYLIITVAACLILSCGENIEEKAMHHLDNAQQAFQNGNYNVAKQEIDSIRILYPKAFETRRKGISLMQQVEEAEQLRTIEYENGMIEQATAAFEKIRSGYAYEKDENYQDLGLYTIKSQAVAKNSNRAYVRAQVDEHGKMTLISCWCGNAYIHHNQVRFSVGDLYAETPVCDDRHEFKDLGVYYERLSFLNGQDGGASAFIAAHKDENITFSVINGKSRGKYYLAKEDRYAIAQLYDLSLILSTLHEHKAIRDEAERKLNFIRSRMQESASKEQAVQ